MSRLAGKVALVTGGASGLGKAIAQRLTRDGAQVIITDVQTGLGAETATELGCEFLDQDVTNEGRWSQVITEVRARHSRLHILVNNAGILGCRGAADPENTQLSDWRRIFAVNVEGVFLGCRAAIPALHASGGGAIVNVSSVAGLLATPYATAYGASKAAVRQLTKSVAQHCAERKLSIRCNSVHPGVVRTPLWDAQAAEVSRLRDVPFEMVLQESVSTIPLGDFTQPQDIAAAVSFLVSDESRHITGAKLVVDGGLIHCDTYRAS